MPVNVEPGLMKEAWDEWNKTHTWENRTLFEMFAAGFFMGWEKANASKG